MGVCTLLRVCQIKSLDQSSIAKSIVRDLFHAHFYVHNMFRA
jgi:hypothetical protein